MHSTLMKLPLLALAAATFMAAGTVTPDAAAKAAKDPKVTVMTRNLYLGTDLAPAIEAIAKDPNTASPAIQTVWAHVKATDFPTRARALAKEIAKKKPALVALQEAALWRSDTPSDGVYATPNAAGVDYDFVVDLVKRLKARGQRYSVAVARNGVDIEIPYQMEDGVTPRDLRFTDRDVILVRKGVRVANVQSGTYAAALPLPIGAGVPLPRVWLSVDATVKGHTFRFVATHLEDDVEAISQPQVDELLAGPLATSMPVVVAGDFNSDAATGVSPAVYLDVMAAGFTDAWASLHPGEPGNTWGQAELLDNVTSQLTQRLDYVFTKGAVAPSAIEILGEEAKDRFHGLWPSDHAGVAVILTLQ